MKKIFTFGVLALLLFSLVGFVNAAAPTIVTSTGAVDFDAFEDLKIEFTVTATGAAADSITLSATGLPAGATFAAKTGTGTVTQTFSWTPTDDSFGSHTVTFKAVNNASTPEENTLQVKIEVNPELCEDGTQGTELEITDFDFDEDEYKVGDKITLDVEVENKGTKDLDVNVEAFLWDVNEEDNIDDFDSDTTDINDDESENFEVELEFPNDNDLDEDTEYVVYVKAYEDNDEDANCVWRKEEVDLVREDNDIIIDSLNVNPLIAQAGDVVELVVGMLNVGSDDQDSVTVEVVNSPLKLNVKSENFDLERAGDDDEITKRLSLRIPDDIAAGQYSLQVRVLDEDEDTYDRGEEFITLTVEGQASPTAELQLSQTSFEIEAGKSMVLQVTVKNTGSSQASYNVDVTPVGGWAGSVSQIVTLDGNSEDVVSIPLSVKSDATAGSNTLLVELKANGETLASSSASVNVKTGLEPVTGGTVYRPSGSQQSTVFWIIADILLVVVIVYFIYLLFRKRK